MNARWLAPLSLCLATIVACEEPGGAPDVSTHDTGRSVDASAFDAAAVDATSDASIPLDAALDGGAMRDLSTDRARFFGASRCTASGALFCEDFESASLDTSRWTVRGAMPSTDAMHVARGTRSMHFHTDANGRSQLSTDDIFPAVGDRYYGRLFVYFDTLPTAPDWAHWTIVGATGSGAAGEIRVGGQWDRMQNRFGIGTDGGATGDWTHLDQDPVGSVRPTPTGEFACIEWLHDGSRDETRFWWDGEEHPSLATTLSDHGGSSVPYALPSFTDVWIGWWLYQASPTPDHFDVWIDEVILDDERIGCVL